MLHCPEGRTSDADTGHVCPAFSKGRGAPDQGGGHPAKAAQPGRAVRSDGARCAGRPAPCARASSLHTATCHHSRPASRQSTGTCVRGWGGAQKRTGTQACCLRRCTQAHRPQGTSPIRGWGPQSPAPWWHRRRQAPLSPRQRSLGKAGRRGVTPRSHIREVVHQLPGSLLQHHHILKS